MKKKLPIKIKFSKRRILKRTKIKSYNLPLFCDFYCKYADFTELALSGACRRESAIFCKLFRRYNNKHAKCLAEK